MVGARDRLLSPTAAAGGWRCDPSLYRGSAAHYAAGRLPYPPELPEVLRAELGLDGGSRALDAGCGPGSLGILLAPLVEEVVGVDADAGMVVAARREAARVGAANTTWLHVRAEALPAGLGRFRLAAFAQSFHWMERERVARSVAAMLEPDGFWLHVNATTHRGCGGGEGLPAPQPPHERIAELVRSYLGAERRAGGGRLAGGPPAGEEDVMRAAGYRGPRRLTVGGGRIHLRSEDDVVDAVHSLSWAAPHLFGARLGAFEADLRVLLRSTAPDGRFAERQRPIEVVVWRPPVERALSRPQPGV